ncbi:tetratricopeptide repeat protein [Acaryochloris sp. IP29b_bin.148]|uniref:tetratricopeptide repeat protein n=1 Tax=Acaryochloris sp. IP29b_bin.148 TaxID=2969218 RepID=UPI00262DC994|nr:tetratricopeptide repeat protein [Acaryochloris sp. IP29b_bin.148]
MSIGLLSRYHLISTHPSPAQPVADTVKNSDEQDSPVERLLAKIQQTQVWEQALKLNPKDAEAHHQLGLVLVAENQVDTAIRHYQRAIALKPSNISRIYQSWGKALVKQNKIEDAISTFRQGITKDYPEAPKAMQEAEVHFRLGLALEAEGRLPEAIKAYRQAITAKPDQLMYEYLGNVLVKNNQVDQALIAFGQTLPRDPSGYHHRLLGDALVRANRVDEARASYLKWLEIDSQHLSQPMQEAYADQALAVSLSSLNRIEPAKSGFRKALERIDPISQKPMAQDFIQFLVDHNQVDEAKEVSQQYFQSDHPFQQIYVQHLLKQSKQLIQSNRLAQAESQCQQAQQILNNPQFLAVYRDTAAKNRTLADLWSCLGQVQFQQGQFETALTYFQQEYQLNPYANRDVAKTLVQLQRPEAALDILLKASSKKVYAYTQLGRLLLTHQQPKMAARYCRQALDIDTQNSAAHHCLATATGTPADITAASQFFQQRSKAISPQVIQSAYRANRMGNDAIIYTVHKDAMGANPIDVKRAQEISPTLADLHLYQSWGDVLVLQEKPQEAIAAYHQTLRLLPETAPTHTSLGKVLMQQQQYGGAIAAYRRAIQLSPYEAQSYVNLSQALQKVGQTEAADLSLQQAVQLGWQDTTADKSQ